MGCFGKMNYRGLGIQVAWKLDGNRVGYLKFPLQNIVRAYDLNDFGWGSRKRASYIAWFPIFYFLFCSAPNLQETEIDVLCYRILTVMPFCFLFHDLDLSVDSIASA